MSSPDTSKDYWENNERDYGPLPEGAGFADRCMNVVAGGDPDLFWALTGKLKHRVGKTRIFSPDPPNEEVW